MQLLKKIYGSGLIRRAILVGAPAMLLASSMSGCGYDDRYYDDRPRRVTRVERVERYPAPPQQVVVEEQPALVDPGPLQSAAPEPVYVPPPAEVVTTYQTELQPYGEWVEVRDYGRCWVPRGRAAGWRPYTMGRWEYSDQREWMWVSEGDESNWGVVTYHYGRWYEDPSYGWVWVPGSTWAPAWVSWREGGGYAGWVPLPPRVRDGYRVDAVVVDRYVPADRYVFVEQRYVGQPRMHEHFERSNVTIINKTTNITNITYVNNRVVNRGVEVAHVEQASGHKIQPVHTVSVTSHEQAAALVKQGRPVIFEPPVIHKAAVEVQQKVKVEHKANANVNMQNNSARTNGQFNPTEARQLEQQREAADKAKQAERERLAREHKAITDQNTHTVTPNNVHTPTIAQQQAEQHRLAQEELLKKQQQQELLKRQQQDELKKKKEQEDLHRATVQQPVNQDILRKQQEDALRKQHEAELQKQAQLKKQQEEAELRARSNQPRILDKNNTNNNTNNNGQPNNRNPKDKDKDKDKNAGN